MDACQPAERGTPPWLARIDLETHPGPAAAIARNGCIVAVNAEWLAFAWANGVEPARVSVGANYLDVCDAGADRGAPGAREIARELRGLLAGEQTEASVLYPCHAPTRERWFRAVARAVTHAGKVVGAVISHVDVTALGFVADHGEGVIITDTAGRVEWINEAMRAITDSRLAEIHGQALADVFRAPDAEVRAGSQLATAIRAGEPAQLELTVHHKTGTPSLIRLDLKPIAEREDAALNRWIAVAYDITQQRREAALQSAQQAVLAKLSEGADLQPLLAALAEAVEAALPDMRLVILTVDREAQVLRPMTAPSMPAAFTEAVDGLAMGPAQASCGAAAWHGARVVAEDIHQHAAWRDHRELARRSGMRACWSEPILDAQGTVLGVLATYFPRARRPSRAEVDFSAHLTTLARWLMERTAFEDELRAARDAALSASAAKTSFLANMSHELRTPLNAVRGYAEIIEHELLGPVGQGKYREYAADIRRSSEHLHDLISHILDYAKLEHGARRPRPENVNIATLIDDVAALLGRPELAIEADPDLTVTTDRQMLRQILVNIVGNALKYGGDNPVDVSVTPDGSGCRIRVVDRGPGIPQAELPRILDPFYRASQTEAVEGSGLGLALSNRLVQHLGGSLNIESALGVGTSVVIDLPSLSHESRSQDDTSNSIA